jgi:hypothetical protein
MAEPVIEIKVSKKKLKSAARGNFIPGISAASRSSVHDSVTR